MKEKIGKSKENRKIHTISSTKKNILISTHFEGMYLQPSSQQGDFLLEKFSELNQFSLFQGIQVQNIQPRIEKILQPDTRSRNTYEEITYAAEVFKSAEVTNIVLVSSPTHLPRCLRDACVIFGGDSSRSSFAQSLYASPSQTSFQGTAASDVAIVEPPHRPNRSKLSKNNLVNRMLKVSYQDEEALLEDLQDILARYSV